MKNFQDDFSPDCIESMFACLNVAEESGDMPYAIKAIQSAINLGPCFTAIDVICALRYFDNKDGRKDIRRHTNTILAIAAMLTDKKPQLPVVSNGVKYRNVTITRKFVPDIAAIDESYNNLDDTARPGFQYSFNGQVIGYIEINSDGSFSTDPNVVSDSFDLDAIEQEHFDFVHGEYPIAGIELTPDQLEQWSEFFGIPESDVPARLAKGNLHASYDD